jgi:hypothetical protein
MRTPDLSHPATESGALDQPPQILAEGSTIAVGNEKPGFSIDDGLGDPANI